MSVEGIRDARTIVVKPAPKYFKKKLEEKKLYL